MGWIINTLSASREISMFEWLLLESQHKIQHHHLCRRLYRMYPVFFVLIYSFQMLEIVIKLNCWWKRYVYRRLSLPLSVFFSLFLSFYHHHFLELCDKWQVTSDSSVLLTTHYHFYYYYYRRSRWFECVESTMSLTYDYDYNFIYHGSTKSYFCANFALDSQPFLHIICVFF